MIGVFILGVLVVVLALLIVWLIVTRDRSSVRRREYQHMKADRDLAISALERIDELTDNVRNILSDPEILLANQVRQIIRDNRVQRTKIK